MKTFLFIGFFLIFFRFVSGQDTNRVFINLQAEYGTMILHSRDLFPVGPSNPYSAGIDYGQWLLKARHWRNCKCYPRLGLSLNYTNYDKPGIWGWGVPAYGFLEPHFPLWRDLYLQLRAGVGYAWLSSPYHAEENPQNLSYSLHFTPFITLGTGLSYRLHENWMAGLQLRYNHASNGGLREPNKGLNYPTFQLGFSYTPASLSFPDHRKAILPDKNNYLSAGIFIAGKAIDATRVTYVVTGAELLFTREISRLNALEGGTEWIINYAYREKIAQAGTDQHHHQLSLLLGHRFLLGNFSFSQQAGIYLHRDYIIHPSWYQRYTLLWNFWKGFSAGTSLKAHGHVAEFLDFRLVWKHGLNGQRGNSAQNTP